MRLNFLRDKMRRGSKRRAFAILFLTSSMVLFARVFYRMSKSTGGSVHSRGRLSQKSTHATFIIPFLRGQGLNNQLWEYRTASIIARATKRTLCVAPFHKFYLQKNGRDFLPFHEIFDVGKLEEYVGQISTMKDCSSACSGVMHRVIELLGNDRNSANARFRSNPYPIADERPGSRKKFLLSTGFLEIPDPTRISVNNENGDSYFGSSMEINRLFQKFSADDCIAIAGIGPEVVSEFMLWNKFLVASTTIRGVADYIKRHVFFDEPYLAIHWRFEESKCAGFGIGIGYDRDRDSRAHFIHDKVITRSSKSANICFYSGREPGTSNKKRLLLVSKYDIVSWIRELMKKAGLKQIYLATDCKDLKLLSWIKKESGATTLSDIEDIVQKSIPMQDNDIVSRLEQEICAKSQIFAGTKKSSWSSRVVEERSIKFENSISYNLSGSAIKGSKVSIFFDQQIQDSIRT
jgi:hypothetical protein